MSQAFEFYSAKIPQADMHPAIYSYKMGRTSSYGNTQGDVYILFFYMRTHTQIHTHIYIYTHHMGPDGPVPLLRRPSPRMAKVLHPIHHVDNVHIHTLFLEE